MKDLIIKKLEEMKEQKTKFNRMAGKEKCFHVKEDLSRRSNKLQNAMDRLALNFNIFSQKLYTKVDQENAQKIVAELMEA
jgi:hypothetical protein